MTYGTATRHILWDFHYTPDDVSIEAVKRTRLDAISYSNNAQGDPSIFYNPSWAITRVDVREGDGLDGEHVFVRLDQLPPITRWIAKHTFMLEGLAYFADGAILGVPLTFLVVLLSTLFLS